MLRVQHKTAPCFKFSPFQSLHSSSLKKLQKAQGSYPGKNRSSNLLVKADLIEIKDFLTNDNIRTFAPAIGIITSTLGGLTFLDMRTNQRIDRLEVSMKKTMANTQKAADARFNELFAKMSQLDAKVNQLDAKISQLDTKVNQLSIITN